MGRTIAAGLLGLCVALALSGCTGDDPSATPGPATPGSPVASSADDGTSPSPVDQPIPAGVRVVEVGDAPVGVASVALEPWLVLPDAGEVLTADGTHVAVGDAPLRLVETPFGVWVSVIRDGTVVRIDPRSGKVDQRVRLSPQGSEPEGLIHADGALWVVDQAGSRVVVLDPETGEQAYAVPTGAAPRLATPDGAGGVWVANYEDASLTHVALSPDCDGRALDCRKVSTDLVRLNRSCLTPQGLALAGDTVWVACTVQSRLVGVDARTGDVVTRINGVDHADAVVTDGKAVYVVGQAGPTVWRVETATGHLGEPLVLDDAPPTTENVAAAFVGTDLVVTHPEAQREYVVSPAALRR